MIEQPDWQQTHEQAAKVQKRQDALRGVEAELRVQDAKWGEQNHPNGTGPDVVLSLADSITYGDLADACKSYTDYAARSGELTYSDIFIEEVFEALAESDPTNLRAELIQAAAVAVAWVEKIDRDASKSVS